MVAHDIEIELDFWDQDDIGAGGEACVEGDPAGVAAHELDDHDTVMRGGGGVHSIERFGRDMYRGLEPEGDVGAVEVVIDCFGHADAVDALLGEWLGNGHGSIATDDDECLDFSDLQVSDADIGEVPEDRVPVFIGSHGVSLRVGLVVGPEDGAAHGEDVGHLIEVEAFDSVLDEAEESVFDTEDLDPVVDGVFDDRADDGVEPRAVAAAGEDGDSFYI